MRARLDILAVGAVLAGFLAVGPELGIEAQAVKRAEALIALVEGLDVEPGRTESLAVGFAEDRSHLRLQIGEDDVLGLRSAIVGLAGVIDRREFGNGRVARRDVARLERGLQRRGIRA